MNAQLKIVVLLLWFLLRESIAIPSFTPPVEVVCIGEELTFSCSISDANAPFQTLWRVDPQQCTNGLISLLVSGPSGEDTDTCGNFTAQTTGSDGDCYTSSLTVTASLELSGTGVTCSDNSGNVAGNTTILIDTGMLELDFVPTYDYETLRLKRIQSKWNAPCSSMTEYNTTVDCGTPVYTSLVPLAACPGETCVSEVNIVSGATGDCTVSVSAAGLSEQTPVSLNNEYVHLSVSDDASPANVAYSFLRGEACLQIEFSYMNENGEMGNVVIASSECGNSAKPLEPFLPPATPYSYVASTFDCGCGPGQFQQAVIIEGTGITGDYDFETCMEDLLLRNDIGINSCGDGNSTKVTITYPTPNGLTTPGSIATYECCSGYRLIGNDATQLTCQPDGSWDGTPPVCDGIPPTCDFVCWIAIILGALLLIATALFIIFLVLYCIEKKNNKAHPDDAREFASSSSPDSKPTTQF